MTATLILSPAAAAEAVCHEEQLRIWAHDDIIDALAMADFLRDDMSYEDGIELERLVMHELKDIIAAAFDHPEARTMLVRDRT
jgi:hypothetical protein